jgi:short subunit dehydrogenase-like uncharacterized protein
MITVIGATGFTGTLITQLLDKDRLPMRLTGRDQTKLDALASTLTTKPERMILDVTNRTALNSAIHGSAVVINCAGPFTTFGMAVADTAIIAGVNYLDITGEQQFIAQVIDRLHSPAVQNQCTVIPSCAFEYTMADTAAALMRQEIDDLDTFESTYYIEGMYTSRGTKRSIICALESPAFQLKGGRLVRHIGGETSAFKIDENKTVQRFPFPGGEVYLVPLHVPVLNVSTYLTAEAPPAVLGIMSFITPLVAKTPLRKLMEMAIDMSEPSPKRTETRFKIFCNGSYKPDLNENYVERMAINISGMDPYYLTALIAAGCAKVLNGESDAPKGVISASMLRGPQFIQTLVESEKVRWERISTS